jgi:hypothetical protein
MNELIKELKEVHENLLMYGYPDSARSVAHAIEAFEEAFHLFQDVIDGGIETASGEVILDLGIYRDIKAFQDKASKPIQ